MNTKKEGEWVLERMRALCSRREYCVAAIRKKISTALGADEAETERIVAKLVEERYIDDNRYASAYAREKASIAGWGVTKIRYMLSAQGVSSEAISAALGDIDAGRAEQRLEKLLENKCRSLKNDPQCKMKLIRFALGRGYTYEQVRPVIDVLLKR